MIKFFKERQTLFYPLLILAAGILAYSNSFQGAFVFDDFKEIINRTDLQVWPPIQALLGHRPLSSLTFALNYQIYGFETWGYHLVNLIIHLLNALLFFNITKNLLQLKEPSTKLREINNLAGIAALLWVVHPLTTESVTYIIQRQESLMALFFLLTCLTSFKFCRSPNTKKSLGYLALSSFFFFLSLGAKEVVITAPLIILLFDRAFITPSFRQVIRKNYKLYLSLIFVALGFIATKLTPLFNSEAISEYSVGTGFGVSPLKYFLTQISVYPHYAKLSIFPVNLNLDYISWQSHSHLSTVPLSALSFLSTLLITLILSLLLRPKLGVVILSIFIFLSPTSTFYPLGDFAAERRMYVPLMLVIVLLTLGFQTTISWIEKKIKLKLTATKWIFVSCILITMTGLTIKRNQTYASREASLIAKVKTDPRNARALYSLGILEYEAGNYNNAITFLESAASLKPKISEIFYYLGKSHLKIGNTQTAKESFEKSAEITPNSAALRELAQIEKDSGENDKHISLLKAALQVNPAAHEIQHDLANALAKKGLISEARKNYTEALTYSKNNSLYLYNLGNTYLAENNLEEAQKKYKEALKHDPQFEPAQQALENSKKMLPTTNNTPSTKVQKIELKQQVSLEEFTDLMSSGEIDSLISK